MRIESLTELQATDDRALLFGPLGLSSSGALQPDLVAEFRQEAVADADLGPEVPEATVRAFERLRRLHAHGVLLYDAYTVASEHALFVLGLALRERFVDFYDDAGVPLVHGDERRRTLKVTSFADFRRELLLANQELQREPGEGKRWKLEYRPNQRMEFSGSFTQLLAWTRHVSLLHGQRNRAVERALGRLRNHAAHPEGYVLEGPVESARTIRDVAGMINRLWGADAGGRLYPEPVQREVMAIGWGGDRNSIVSFHAYPDQRMPDESRSFVLVLAVPHDPQLHQYSTRFEKTAYPADLLFGPATWEEAREWLLVNEPTADAVDCLDRLFAVQECDGHVDLPRRQSVAAALPEDRREGTWYLLRADHPSWAYVHIRGPGGTPRESCAHWGACSNCPVEIVARGSWQEVVARSGYEPEQLPDVEVPTPWNPG